MFVVRTCIIAIKLYRTYKKLSNNKVFIINLDVIWDSRRMKIVLGESFSRCHLNPSPLWTSSTHLPRHCLPPPYPMKTHLRQPSAVFVAHCYTDPVACYVCQWPSHVPSETHVLAAEQPVRIELISKILILPASSSQLCIFGEKNFHGSP